MTEALKKDDVPALGFRLQAEVAPGRVLIMDSVLPQNCNGELKQVLRKMSAAAAWMKAMGDIEVIRQEIDKEEGDLARYVSGWQDAWKENQGKVVGLKEKLDAVMSERQSVETAARAAWEQQGKRTDFKPAGATASSMKALDEQAKAFRDEIAKWSSLEETETKTLTANKTAVAGKVQAYRDRIVLLEKIVAAE